MPDLATAMSAAVNRSAARGQGAMAVASFKLGEVTCQVRTPLEADRIARRWDPFRTQDPPQLVANVFVDPTAAELAASATERLVRASDERRFRSFWRNGHGFVMGQGMIGRFDLGSHTLDVAVYSSRHVPTAAIAIRFAVSFLVERAGGFLLHCSGVVHRRRALLFFGPSESGKSTIAGLARADHILSGEAVIVQKSDDQWTAYGTPFSPELGGGANASAKVGAMIKLTKARAGEAMDCRPISGRRAAQDLLRCVIALDDAPRHKAGSAAHALEAAEAVPLYELRFRPEPEVWPFLLEHVDGEVWC
ncbi:MAG: hypothetical protein R6V58_06560 [Planctomycetota bacterium]